MNEFQRIKDDHFLNIPYTKKQITDIYNTINGTSKIEQNLVFVKTEMFFLQAGTSNYFIDLTVSNEFGFCHYVMQESDSKFAVGFPSVGVQIENQNGSFDQLKNFFFTNIQQNNSVSFYCVSVFKFA